MSTLLTIDRFCEVLSLEWLLASMIGHLSPCPRCAAELRVNTRSRSLLPLSLDKAVGGGILDRQPRQRATRDEGNLIPNAHALIASLRFLQ